MSKHCTWSSVNSRDWQQEWSFSDRKSAGFRLASCSPIVTESKLKINVTETQTKTWVAWGGDHKCYGFEMNSNVPFTMRNNTGERRQEIIHSYPFTPLAPFHQDHVLDLPEPTRQASKLVSWLNTEVSRTHNIGLMRLKESQSSVTGRDFSLEWFVEWLLNGLLFKRAHILTSVSSPLSNSLQQSLNIHYRQSLCTSKEPDSWFSPVFTASSQRCCFVGPQKQRISSSGGRCQNWAGVWGHWPWETYKCPLWHHKWALFRSEYFCIPTKSRKRLFFTFEASPLTR